MINRIPDYLKLFIDEDQECVDKEFSIPQIDRFCNVFPEVTGLKLNVTERREDGQLSFPWSSAQQLAFNVAIEPTSRSKLSSLADTREFENALASLLNLLADTRRQLLLREAELAAAVPVVSVGDDDQHLADRLHHVLRGTADMTRCSAAALYMLDEATTSLKLRASFGIDPDAYLLAPRPLEDAVADVEALAGHAVVIDNTELRSHWQVPHACQAAMCVPVATATTILGTLWMFRDFAADFRVEEQNLAEITAGRLASDLDRAVLTQEVRSLRRSTGHGSSDTPTSIEPTSRSNANWQIGYTQREAPQLVGWELADGVTDPEMQMDFCDWHQSDTERLHLTLGASRAANRQPSALAFRSIHAAHMSHDPQLGELIQHTNQSLWRSSAEGNEAALFHAILDPSCGRLEYALAGDLQAYMLRPHAWEPLLASRVPLGVDEQCECPVHRQILMPGDILFAMSLSATATANMIAEKLLHHIHLPATELTRLAIEELAVLSSSSDDSIAVLVAKRDESS